MGVSAGAKYIILLILGLILAVGTYLEGQPVITASVVLSATLTGVTFLISEFENNDTNQASS